jgi:hypothetical protein
MPTSSRSGRKIRLGLHFLIPSPLSRNGFAVSAAGFMGIWTMASTSGRLIWMCFVQFDNWFPLFGVMSVAIFSLYLLFCVVAGNFKFGMRFLCITLHPMKINGTYMNSFLFNLILILLCTFPVIDFCTAAFAGYARFSSIYQFFGVQMQHLIFFS